MPEADDTRTLVPLAPADVSSDDLIQVYHAASNTVRKSPAPSTESVLALLEGEVVPLDGVILGDQGELIPAEEGALIRNHNSLAWSEDPEDGIVGGTIIYDESRTFGYKQIAAAEYVSVDVRKVLGSVWVPARFAVDGSFLDFFGSLKINSNAGALPFYSLLGFATDSNKLITGLHAGELVGFDLTDIDGVCVYQNLAGYLPLTEVSGDASKVEISSAVSGGSNNGSKIPTSGDVVSAPVISFDNYTSTDPRANANAGEGFNLYLVLDVPAGSVPSSSLSVFWDFTIRGR